MKYRLVISSVLAALSVPAMAQVIIAEPAPAVIVETPPAVVVETTPAVIVDAPVYPAERILVPAVRPSGAIHGGAVTFEDEKLLSDAVSSLASDRSLNNMTVTMVAKNGELIVNGVANDDSQAARAERNLKGVAPRVSSRWTTQTG